MLSSSTQDSAPVLVSANEDGILVIRLNRPHVRNAVNRELSVQLAATLDRLDADPALRVGVLTGDDNAFSSGMDLGALLQGENPHIDGRGFAGIAEKAADKPLIAAIEGYALAGGFEVALACDILVASRGAVFGLPEPKRGIVASGGGLVRLAERLPYHVAMELALTGEPIDGERAYELGLVTHLTERGGALEKAMMIAWAIVQNAPLAVGASKAILKQSRDWPSDDAFGRQRRYSDICAKSKDAHEGALAFMEKRRPVWRGV